MMWTYLTTDRTAPEVPFQPGQLLQTSSSYWTTGCTVVQSEANTLFTFTSKVEVSFGRGGRKKSSRSAENVSFRRRWEIRWVVKNKLIGGTGWHGVIRAGLHTARAATKHIFVQSSSGEKK